MRAAIFFAPPPDHPLAVAAAAWLGRDAFSGEALAQPPVEGFDASEVAALTADPRRYGFHATLKPPFRFAAGHDLAALRDAVDGFCRTRTAVAIPELRLERLGPFFALTPANPLPELDALAADIVRDFDRFRAPPSEAEIARRRPASLPERQRRNLAAWGYPYVFEDFRFHMTLTGPVSQDRHEAMQGVLSDRFASFLGRPLLIDALAIFVEMQPPGDFVVDTCTPLAAIGQPMDVA